ncbi:hypothetical protein GCM10010345_46260 [Streptomyces canarius]|uniref:Uncharacterized protein n=1 Tax=Streptomyces canarius TaxID=285453 RepID=A0ABQ3CRZ5_9ACTN|nr:hypothetical protein GCM10010345_46260 [Streptomyces canarius]
MQEIHNAEDRAHAEKAIKPSMPNASPWPASPAARNNRPERPDHEQARAVGRRPLARHRAPPIPAESPAGPARPRAVGYGLKRAAFQITKPAPPSREPPTRSRPKL